MPLSYQEITDPSSTTFTVSFEFLNLSDIKAVGKLNSASTWTELPVTGAATTSNGVTTVTVADAGTYSSAGAIRLYRASTQNPLVDFQNGSRLSESDLDTAYRQGLFAAQEVRENASENITTVGPAGPTGAAGADGADAVITTGSIANDKLENSSVTINGSAVALGGSTTVGGGKIGQVVSVATTTPRSTTSSSFTAVSDMSLNITPTATSSKIYLQAMQTMSFGNSGGYWSHVTIFRNGVNLSANDNGLGAMRTNTGDNYITIPLIYMDSPSSISQQTYQIYFRSPNGINVGYNSLSSGASLVAMEVLA